jgi:hypothetical protein
MSYLAYGAYLGKDNKIYQLQNFIILPVPTALGVFHEI